MTGVDSKTCLLEQNIKTLQEQGSWNLAAANDASQLLKFHTAPKKRRRRENGKPHKLTFLEHMHRRHEQTDNQPNILLWYNTLSGINKCANGGGNRSGSKTLGPHPQPHKCNDTNMIRTDRCAYVDT